MFTMPLDTSDLAEKNKKEIARWEERVKKTHGFAEKARGGATLPSIPK